MFKAYLREYPDGKFSKLAKIYMEKLDCNDLHQDVAKKPKVDIQPDVTMISEEKSKRELTLDSRARLAVLPFYFTRHDPNWGQDPKPQMIKNLSKALMTNQSFVPVYSYYPLEPHVTAKRISPNIIDDKFIDAMWPRRDFFSSDRNPDINVISSLGHRLEVDLVLTGSFLVDRRNFSWDITYYLCEVRSKKIYSTSASYHYSNFHHYLKSFTEEYFASYEKDKLK